MWGNVTAGLGGITADFGTPLSIALGVLLTLSPLVLDRFVIRRKRIDYRVLYNSKIGLNPIPGEYDDASSDAHPTLRHLTSMVDRMSVVVIRIRNVGSFDIEKNDFDTPISFSFGERVVWDARISEASSPDLRELARENLSFFSNDTVNPPGHSREAVKESVKESGNLRLVRDWLGRRLSTTLEPTEQPVQHDVGPQWHGVRLNKLSLKRKEKFKLVVVLQEPEDAPEGETTKTVQVEGRIENGWLKDEKKQRRFTLSRMAMVISVLLTGALVATTVIVVANREPGYCAQGSVHIGGSSAFVPTIEGLAQEYEQACSGANITTVATGSIDGIEQLRNPASASGDWAVFTDGRVDKDSLPEPLPVAVVTYAIVVHKETRVDKLTTADLRSIYSGTKTQWDTVPGALPIKIVDRNDLSGTRQTFEDKVLEGPATNENLPQCDSRNLAPQAPSVHCQTADTGLLLDRVSTTPGAIGYADVHSAHKAVREGANLTVVPLDGITPDASKLAKNSGYPFWTVEYLYKENPGGNALLDKFTEYVTKGPAVEKLREAQYLPCTDPGTRELCGN